MSKPRNDSIWNQLSLEQQQTLRGWLIEENLGYAEVLERAQREWNVTASRASLARYYKRLAWQVRLDKAQVMAQAVQESDLDIATVRLGALKLIGRRLLDSALESGETKELSGLANLLLQHEQQEIQRAWLKLAREKFQFKASEAALDIAPVVEQFKREDMERDLDRERARIEMIKNKLFGKYLDDIIE